MAKGVTKKAVKGLRINDVRDKRITVLKTDFKRGKSAKRYAEMVAFVQRGKGKATFGDVLANMSYHMGDVRWDIAHGHIKFADTSDFGPAGEMPGSTPELAARHETEAPLNSQVELQRALLWEEGELSQRVVTVRSRSSSVRELCIKTHGSRCLVCKFDFGERFGEMFAGLIEVHHKNPIALRDGGANTDPESDCVPLCPNCHRMAHFGRLPGDCRSLDELLELFARREHMVEA